MISYVEQSITVATALTPPSWAHSCEVQVDTNCRLRLDGINPTAAVGTQIGAGIAVPRSGMATRLVEDEMKAAKFIPESGTAVLRIHYFDR